MNRRIGKGENEAVVINKSNRRIGSKAAIVRKKGAKVQPLDEPNLETDAFSASPDVVDLMAKGGDNAAIPPEDSEHGQGEETKSHIKFKGGKNSGKKKANYKTYGIIYEGEDGVEVPQVQPQASEVKESLPSGTKKEETVDEAKLRRKAEAEARAAKNKKSMHVDEDTEGTKRKKTTYKKVQEA
jgi:hypothetical protein